MNTETLEQRSDNQKRNILVICFIIFFIFAISVLIYFLLTSNTPKNNNKVNEVSYPVNENQQESEEQTVEITNTTYKFEGNFVEATLPIDWTIKEYSDEDGMYEFVTTEGIEFGDLTGFEILNENDTRVFSVNGVDGIGGGGGCVQVVKFEDTEESYIQSIIDETEEFGFGTTEVFDASEEEYTEVLFLGKRFRRIVNQLYIATEGNPDVFNTVCGVGAQFTVIDALGFTIDDGTDSYSLNAYAFGINETILDDTTLEKLDAILESISEV